MIQKNFWREMLVSEADPRLNAGVLLAVVDGSTFHAGCKSERQKIKLSRKASGLRVVCCAYEFEDFYSQRSS
jgi:hypothetical protein